MATSVTKTINIGSDTFDFSCWSQLGIAKNYMLALLGRDEYCPVASSKPTSSTTTYTDPDSGNAAVFHAGQCVVYLDSEATDGIGLSIVKNVVTDSSGNATSVNWLHVTDIEKSVNSLLSRVAECERLLGYWNNGEETTTEGGSEGSAT